MRYVLYALAWCCLLGALVLAEFTTASGAAYRVLWPVLLACSVLLAGAGYVYTRRTTRKCPHCGERMARSQKECSACTAKLGTVRGDL